MAEAKPGNDRLNVFVSYARDDLEFADQLAAALIGTGFDVVLDRHAITGADEWKRRLAELVQLADTIVFVLSPASLRSDVCSWEIDEAAKLGKRIIPVVCRAVEGGNVPPRISILNYIFFYADQGAPGSGFGSGLVKLIAALNEDPHWLREHTRLLGLATQWLNAGRPSSRLLSGDDIDQAKAWLVERRKTNIEPTSLHLEYIRASEDMATARLAEDRRQLDERERLLREAEIAIGEKELAQKKGAEASRSLVRRTMAGMITAVVLALLAGAFGWYALQQQAEANLQRQAALKQQKEAEELTIRAESSAGAAMHARRAVVDILDKALLTQSKYLADASKQAAEQLNDPATGLLLALEALPDRSSEDTSMRTRPVWGPAEASLEANLRLLRERVVLKGHSSAISSVAAMPDGVRVVTASFDRTVRVWDIRTGAELLLLSGKAPLTSVSMTPDGERIIAGSNDGTARIWDVRTGAELAVLKGHTGAILDVAVMPDGSRIVTASQDRTVRIWDAANGVELRVFRGHAAAVNGVAIAADANSIVTGSDDGTARIWDPNTGAEIGALSGNSQAVTSIASTHDGKQIIMGLGDRTARIMDAATGSEIAVLRGHSGAVNTVAVTPDGARVFTASDDGSVRVWELNGGSMLSVSRGHAGEVLSLAIAPDGSSFITGSADGTARIWDSRTSPESMRLSGHTQPVTSLAVSTDGLRLLTGSADNTARIWDTRGALLHQLKGHTSAVNAVVVAPDGNRIFTGSYDGTARGWDTRTGTELLQLKGHTRPVTSIAVTPDGSRVITGSADETVRVWAARTGAALAELKGHTSAVLSVAALPDGARIVTGSYDRTARIWDLKTGKELVRLDGHGQPITSVAATPDGSRVVTGSDDRTVRLWDANTGAEILRLTGHEGNVTALAVSTDGSRIVSGSRDRTARIWDLRSGALISVLKGHDDTVTSVAFTIDGSHVVTGSADKSVREWELYPSGQALIDLARKIIPRCLTTHQRQTHHLDPVPPRWCEVSQRWPNDAITLAQNHMRRGRHAEAVAVLSKAAELDPQSSARISSLLSLARERASRPQDQPRVTRIGIIDNGPIWDNFRSTLRKLGYIEGEAVSFEYRATDSEPQRMVQAAAELASLPVDIIVTFGTPASLAAKRATSSIPIVAISIGDPIGTKLATRMDQPGGNVTGNTSSGPQLAEKVLAVAKDLFPNASRAAFLLNPNNPSNIAVLDGFKAASAQTGFEIIPVEVRSASDFSGAFSGLTKRKPDVLLGVNDPLQQLNIGLIVDLLAQHKIPGIFQARANVLAGGLVSYGPSLPELFRHAAGYVHFIIQGAKPSEMPFEPPTQYELIFNLKTAKQLDLKVPQPFLARVDEVIE